MYFINDDKNYEKNNIIMLNYFIIKFNCGFMGMVFQIPQWIMSFVIAFNSTDSPEQIVVSEIVNIGTGLTATSAYLLADRYRQAPVVL